MSSETLAVSEKRELVARVADSPPFQKSPRLREFLLYVADCTLGNRLEDAREQQIAQQVFHRKPGYNPGLDNIVRVEARSLRKRLETFFDNEGKDEPMVIRMPKGSYSISFEPREKEPEALPDEPPAPVSPSRSNWRTRALAAAVIVLAGLLVVQWRLRNRENGPEPQPAPRTLPFSALTSDTKDTYIVTSDASLIIMEELARRQISLDEYINRRYPAGPASGDPSTLDLMRSLGTRQYTNAAEVSVALKLMSMSSGRGHRVFLRYSRDMQLADFKDHNVILLGSPVGNPWARLPEPSLNFEFGINPDWRGLIRNRSPRPGEQPIYSMITRSGETGQAYASVAFIPNLTGSGSLLLVAGTTGEGTQAAGEFISDELRASKALRAMGIDPAGPPRYFEILLKVQAVAGSPSQSSVLAWRLVPESK